MAGVKVTLKARKKANMRYESFRNSMKIANMLPVNKTGRMREIGGLRQTPYSPSP